MRSSRYMLPALFLILLLALPASSKADGDTSASSSPGQAVGLLSQEADEVTANQGENKATEPVRTNRCRTDYSPESYDREMDIAMGTTNPCETGTWNGAYSPAPSEEENNSKETTLQTIISFLLSFKDK